MISFKCSKQDSETIGKIVDRALLLHRNLRIVRPVSRMDMHMDITACHCNGCPLRLRDLLAADDANFGHDVFGISRHIDRKTGRLGGSFLPRFAKPETPDRSLAVAGLAVVGRLLDEDRRASV